MVPLQDVIRDNEHEKSTLSARTPAPDRRIKIPVAHAKTMFLELIPLGPYQFGERMCTPFSIFLTKINHTYGIEATMWRIPAAGYRYSFAEDAKPQ
jgi:hypothetical protein